MIQVVRAMTLAERWHRSQVRKYTGEPYIVHCLEVATIVARAKLPEEAVAAALLHDVLEDTECTAVEIHDTVGGVVEQLVLEVTDVSRPEDGKRAKRKEIDRLHLAHASYMGKGIKLADLISNTRSIVPHDPGFGRVFLEEKRLLLEVLSDGPKELYEAAQATLQWGLRRLGMN